MYKSFLSPWRLQERQETWPKPVGRASRRLLAAVISLTALTAGAYATVQDPAAQQGQKPPAEQPRQPAPPPAQPAAPQPQAPAASEPTGVGFRLENADLLQVIGIIAAQLKINYIVDPAVKGSVNINTAGDLRREDLFSILETILKINGATAIQSGNFFRIVPLPQAPKSPLEIYTDPSGQKLPGDDRMIMQIIPLRFIFAADMAKMIAPFLSDGGSAAVHETGNVLILVDHSLNLKRLMELLAQFDSPAFAEQRVRLVTVKNSLASRLAGELESVFSAYALSGKNTPLRFVPIDRMNAILVVSPDAASFAEVEKWISKLDQAAPSAGIQTFIYRVENSEAEYLARLLTAMQNEPTAATAAGSGASTESLRTSSGSALPTGVRIIPDAVNNSLIFQCSAQQYAQITASLKELDILPRQVLIEARVYEVTLDESLSFGLTYFLRQRSNDYKKGLASFTPNTGLETSAGMLIGQTRELMGFLEAKENRSRVRVVSAPTVLAMDNSPARIQVGSQVPTLTSQGVIGGVQAGATSVFTNQIQNRDTGIILNVVPRITTTGMVSLQIAQEISSAQAPPANTIQSPSFLVRAITTRAVVKDGETVALGGLMQENQSISRNRIPFLGDIPGIGALFGSTSRSVLKTELIVMLTPRIAQTVEAARDNTSELRDKLKALRRSFQKDLVLNPVGSSP